MNRIRKLSTDSGTDCFLFITLDTAKGRLHPWPVFTWQDRSWIRLALLRKLPATADKVESCTKFALGYN